MPYKNKTKQRRYTKIYQRALIILKEKYKKEFEKILKKLLLKNDKPKTQTL